MDHNARIEQWEKMCREAPDDMSWFSLGSAYKDGGRLDDADRAFSAAIDLNPGMSRAYQLRAQALIQLNKNDEAAQVLLRGYTIAAERGDVMPQKAMGSLLEKIGRPVPQIEAATPKATVAITGEGLVDRKTGERGNRLPDPPMRGPLGKFIFDHYTNETWQQWIRQGTKVINELRLDFSNDSHQHTYEEQMIEWLGFTREEANEYAKTAKP